MVDSIGGYNPGLQIIITHCVPAILYFAARFDYGPGRTDRPASAHCNIGVD